MIIPRWIDEKRRWWRYRARIKALPADYRTAVEALERYLYLANFGRSGGDGWAEMFEDLADLFEQSAANGTPVRAIVGEDPEAFVEAFVQNYPEGQWRIRERERLNSAIDRAAGGRT